MAADKNDNSGIVGGEAVDASDTIAHSTVQLFILAANGQDESGQTRYSVAECTGSVISKNVILTAAHCTQKNPRQIFAYFSAEAPTDLPALFKAKSPLLKQISGGLTDVKWPTLSEEKLTDWGDIALLKFDGEMPAGYKPATLIPARSKVKTNDFVTLAGFGITDGKADTSAPGLMKVDVVVTDANYSVSELLVGDESGKGACHGDSGGPAYMQVGTKQYLVGITSRADIAKDPNGLCTAGSIYTSVHAYLKVIADGIKTLEDPAYVPTPIAQPFVKRVTQ